MPGNEKATEAIRLILESLMKFLEEEVQNEERISMARLGFQSSLEAESSVGKAGKQKKQVSNTSAGVATAANLLAAKETPIFCQGLHGNASCDEAKHMSLSSRQAIAKEKRVCFACLKTGHNAIYCKSKNKCPWCGRKHVLLMC